MIETVGRYKIVDKIGQGGMGVVYKALDPLLQRTVAVKLIGEVAPADFESRERFLREARAAGGLAHRNIIVIHDLGEDQERLYLAMEYLVGRSLSVFLAEGRPPLRRALEIIIDVCHGLEYAHHQEIVHRDIKPANIFVTDTGEVKILDFGLARLVSSSLTRSQALIGTVNYMAPEQVLGEQVDRRADLFAVGAVLYEMLVGRKAFESPSFANTMYRILQNEPEPIETHNPDVPADLIAVVRRALAKRPDDRYQSAGDLLRDLVVFRDSASVALLRDGARTRTPEVGTSTVRLVRRDGEIQPRSGMWSQRRARTTALVGGLLTIGFVGSYLWRPVTPSAPVSSNPAGPAVEVPVAGGAPALPSPSVSASQEATTPTAPPERPAPPPAAERSPAAVERRREPDAIAASRAAEETKFAAAMAKLGQTRASAEAAGAPTLAMAAYGAAIALETEARQLLASGRPTEAIARAVESDASFRGAEIEARAEASSRERLRPVDPPVPARSPPSETRTAPAAEPPRAESRPAPRAPEPVVTPANAEDAIREVIAQYVGGLESRNLAALKRVWPSLGGAQERAIQAEFQNARAVQARFVDPRITVSGETATVTGIRQYNLVTQDGQRLATVTRTTISLSHGGGAWVIERVNHQPQ